VIVEALLVAMILWKNERLKYTILLQAAIGCQHASHKLVVGPSRRPSLAVGSLA
jgi:hypothetical protein